MERNRISTSGMIAKRFDDLGRVTALRRMYIANHYIRRATSGGACSTDTLLLPLRTKSAGVFGYCMFDEQASTGTSARPIFTGSRITGPAAPVS